MALPRRAGLWGLPVEKQLFALCVLSRLGRVRLCDSSPPGSSVHGILRARTLEWFSHALLQEIFPTQGSNPGLPHCRQILYHLSHQGRPRYSFFLYNFNNFCWTPNIHQELKHINALCMLPHLILSGRFYDFHFKMRSVKLIGD